MNLLTVDEIKSFKSFKYESRDGDEIHAVFIPFAGWVLLREGPGIIETVEDRFSMNSEELAALISDPETDDSIQFDLLLDMKYK